MQVTVVPWPSRLVMRKTAAMQLDQRARDGEPKPAALMALGELVLDLLERPAELGDVGLGDADAGILDGDLARGRAGATDARRRCRRRG